MKWTGRQTTEFVWLAALTLALAGFGRAQADVILPTDARGIRQLPGQTPFLLNFLAINRSIEDRSVIEFDIQGLSGVIPPTTLDLDLLNLDPGGPVGIIAVFTFAGTGTVTPGLFSAGAFFTDFDNNESGLEHVDVTAAVQAAVNAEEPFLGFRLSTLTSDRFFIGPPFTGAGSTLTVIPEPTTLTLLALGTLGLLGCGWRAHCRPATWSLTCSMTLRIDHGTSLGRASRAARKAGAEGQAAAARLVRRNNRSGQGLLRRSVRTRPGRHRRQTVGQSLPAGQAVGRLDQNKARRRDCVRHYRLSPCGAGLWLEIL